MSFDKTGECMSDFADYFEILFFLAQAKQPLSRRYLRLLQLLEQLCGAFTVDSRLQMTDLSARINYLALFAGLTNRQLNTLHTLRITANNVLNNRLKGDESLFSRDWQTLVTTVALLYKLPVPNNLQALFKEYECDCSSMPPALKRGKMIHRIRVCYERMDEEFLYVRPMEFVSPDLLRVRYGIKGDNDFFDDLIPRLWTLAQLNLLQVKVDEEGILTPGFIVLEPDYLVDISSLAECFKDYGHHPANYLLGRMKIVEPTRAILLGNLVNYFLDAWVYTKGEVDYRTCMQQAFRQYALELSTCEEIVSEKDARSFFADCKKHFENVRSIVRDVFKDAGYNLDAEDAVLEPSYICEALGLQGRLDYMQRDMSSFIEMKSGRADEYSMPGKVIPKENNRIQMLLYMALLEFSMNRDHRKIHSYLLYTRYKLLYPARSEWSQVKRAIEVRNLIVAADFHTQQQKDIIYTRSLFAEISPTILNTRQLDNVLWKKWIKPDIEAFGRSLAQLPELAQHYYYALYNFIVAEQYTSKSGDCDTDSHRGACLLWRSSLAEKQEQGEILVDLSIKQNHAGSDLAWISMMMPDYGGLFSPNFRMGDAVVLYERNNPTDNITNRIFFKGYIRSITADEVILSLRSKQRNSQIMPMDSHYAIEHDLMDVASRRMFHSLTLFAEANSSRRDLFLGNIPPRFDKQEQLPFPADDFTSIVKKALSARDYYLLIGPPGTGKTSWALKEMVMAYLLEPGTQLLLMAYTNRAVDEICKSLLRITPTVDFIRIGHHEACDKAYRSYLLEEQLADCVNRADVLNRFGRCRIIVGTTMAISAHTEIFKLKAFKVAIIDEATQILEPQLLGLLCARCPDGQNAIERFILIGDQKQLPAVVQQSAQSSAVQDELLLSAGFRDFRDSLFERLYRQLHVSGHHEAYDMLCRQGRMHPLVAGFINHHFYEGQLQIVGLAHQLDFNSQFDPRVTFIPSHPDTRGSSYKCNQEEAIWVGKLVKEVYDRDKEHFDPHTTVGIITPYRNQVSLIKHELQALGIKSFNEVLVDTVERYQGSERDVIIYSFCVNNGMQLKYLPNLLQEDGYLVDRKLNVAMTRARKQLYIIGVPELLQKNKIYKALINETAWIKK